MASHSRHCDLSFRSWQLLGDLLSGPGYEIGLQNSVFQAEESVNAAALKLASTARVGS